MVELLSKRKMAGSKWVYKTKIGENSTVQHYKARLVSQSYTQKYGADYNETFCPVARQESLTVLQVLLVQYKLQLQ